jgi:bacillithiol system protein YtxJ
MSILKNVFKSNSSDSPKKNNNISWIRLDELVQLNEIQEVSKNEIVLLFKHSTRCGISAIVKKRFEKMFDGSMSELKTYYLDLLTYRNISNEIEAKFNIMHQSPQLLVIKNGVVLEHRSHYDILTIDLKKYI